jgi:hypothetical protein
MNQQFLKISRATLQLYLECPRCFWLAKKFKIKRPKPYPYTLNSLIDILLKSEFDEARNKKEPHDIFKQHRVEAIPFPDYSKIKEWRNNGIAYYFPELNAKLYGKIDEVVMFLIDQTLSPIDFKATGCWFFGKASQSTDDIANPVWVDFQKYQVPWHKTTEIEYTSRRIL